MAPVGEREARILLELPDSDELLKGRGKYLTRWH